MKIYLVKSIILFLVFFVNYSVAYASNSRVNCFWGHQDGFQEELNAQGPLLSTIPSYLVKADKLFSLERWQSKPDKNLRPGMWWLSDVLYGKYSGYDWEYCYTDRLNDDKEVCFETREAYREQIKDEIQWTERQGAGELEFESLSLPPEDWMNHLNMYQHARRMNFVVKDDKIYRSAYSQGGERSRGHLWTMRSNNDGGNVWPISADQLMIEEKGLPNNHFSKCCNDNNCVDKRHDECERLKNGLRNFVFNDGKAKGDVDVKRAKKYKLLLAHQEHHKLFVERAYAWVEKAGTMHRNTATQKGNETRRAVLDLYDPEGGCGKTFWSDFQDGFGTVWGKGGPASTIIPVLALGVTGPAGIMIPALLSAAYTAQSIARGEDLMVADFFFGNSLSDAKAVTLTHDGEAVPVLEYHLNDPLSYIPVDVEVEIKDIHGNTVDAEKWKQIAKTLEDIDKRCRPKAGTKDECSQSTATQSALFLLLGYQVLDVDGG